MHQHGDENCRILQQERCITETVSSDAVRGYLRELPQSLQRVKGYLQTPEGIVEVQQVGGQIEIHPRPQLIKGSHGTGFSVYRLSWRGTAPANAAVLVLHPQGFWIIKGCELNGDWIALQRDLYLEATCI